MLARSIWTFVSDANYPFIAGGSSSYHTRRTLSVYGRRFQVHRSGYTSTGANSPSVPGEHRVAAEGAIPRWLAIAGIPMSVLMLANAVMPMAVITLWFLITSITLTVRPLRSTGGSEHSVSREPVAVS